MRQVIVLEELSQQEAAALFEALANVEFVSDAQKLDYLMEDAETPMLDAPYQR